MNAMSSVILPVSFTSSAGREAARPIGSFALLLTREAGASKAGEADFELLACCREAKAVNQEAVALMNKIEALDDDDPAVMLSLEEASPLFIAYSDAILSAGQLPARTPEGLRAKAALLLLHLTTEDDPVALAASLARDVAGRT